MARTLIKNGKVISSTGVIEHDVLLEGVILVVIVLFIFLGDLRSAIIVGVNSGLISTAVAPFGGPSQCGGGVTPDEDGDRLVGYRGDLAAGHVDRLAVVFEPAARAQAALPCAVEQDERDVRLALPRVEGIGEPRDHREV